MLACCPASAQTIPFKRYTAKDGLANAVIFRMCRDGNGYIWITTAYGISRFDGSHFHTFDYNLFRNTSLAICADRKGDIWSSGMSDGLFQIRGDSVKRTPIAGDVHLRADQIMLVPDAKDRIWAVSARYRVGYIDQGRLHRFHLPGYTDPKKEPNVFQIAPGLSGDMLLATDSGLFSSDPAQHIARRLKEVPVFAICRDRESRYYFGSIGKIYTLFQGRLDSMRAYEGQQVRNIRVYKNGSVWYTTERPGLFFASKNNCPAMDYATQLGLGQVFINDMLTTEDGTLILGTYGKGLYVINRPNLLSFDVSSGLPTNNVNALSEDSAGTIYAGGFNGVSYCQGGHFIPINALRLRPEEQVNDILVANHQLWVASSHRIYRYDLRSHSIREHSPGALCLTSGRDGSILAGGYTFSERFDPTKPFSKTNDTIFRRFPRVRINANLAVSTKEYWLATSGGVFRIRSDSDRKQVSRSGAAAIAPDGDGIWAAGADGLLSIDAKDSVYYHRQDDHSTLPAATALASSDSTLWIGTVHGLYALKGGKLRAYNTNGLPDDRVNALRFDLSGRLWIGTSNGLYCWNLSEETWEHEQPHLVVRRVRLGNSVLSAGSSGITLPFHHGVLSVDYDAVDFNAPESIIFEYRMKGVDSTWYTSESRTIRYNALAPGDYTFQLHARYSRQPVSSALYTLPIHVLKPFWQKAWFILPVCCLALIILAAAGRFYTRHLQARERRKTQRYVRLLQLKQQAANTLLNSHFIFNSLNSIQSFINQADTLSANRYLSKFARLIRTAMQHATNLTISLAKELEMAELYLSLESIRLSGKLTFSIRVDSNINREKITIPSMLIQPHLENAVWHGITPKGGNGHIDIAIHKKMDSFLEVIIQDNGVGYTQSTQTSEDHKSMGISLTKQRIDIIRKLTGKAPEFLITTIKDTSQNVIGTRAQLLIPIKEH